MTSMLFSRIFVATDGSFELSVVVKAAVLLVTALLAARMARAARASVRHMLLAAALCVLAILPVVTVAMPPVPVDIPMFTIESSALPLANAGWESGATRTSDRGVMTTARARVAVPMTIATVLRAAWALGMVVFLLPVVAALIRLRRLRLSGLPWLEIRPLAHGLATDAGIVRSVDVLLHQGLPVPMTVGWLRPTILLPVDAREWTEAECRNALVHELEHVRRADWIFQVVGRLTCGLYWFLPLVWIAWREMALDAERACDDAVLQSAEGPAYATQLVNLASRHASGIANPALAMANRSDLAARVSAILNGQQARGRAGVIPVAVMAIAAVFIVVTVSPLRAVVPVRARLMGSPLLQAQTPAVAGGQPAFDVISIKRNIDPNSATLFTVPAPGRVRLVHQTVRMLISSSYGIQDYQIIGGPDWLRTERYDTDAIAEGAPPPPPPQLLLRVRTLLADRFKLVIHAETRELPIYRLVKVRADGRLGPNIHPSTCKPPEPTNPNAVTNAAIVGGTCGNRIGQFSMTIGGNTMNGFANQLGRLIMIGRPVVNATNLTDTFDWELAWAADPSSATGATVQAQGPDRAGLAPDAVSIFTALEEQLGLKLEPARGPVDVLVIDSVDRAIEN